ncbi:MAG TPA: PD-(D/E)XK nuclease family protein [Candidatus Marinimicrobia bacterium]|jgi:ATP-dependent exoDNAse (exonuclease V) beta subunit|nr:PD-(D/E)XK nuclease family protein [Candidatus Neomarinimicrobiota bacterium]|tara:strand:+ start:7817 stop:8533 length:717 start_codon:yes stop_codon:yes gene_type:complete
MKIKKSIVDNQISLIEETHQYVLETNPGLSFQSVTTVVGSFFEPFDSIKIATNLCDTHPKYKNMRPEQLIQEWQTASNHGTKVHKEIELSIKENLEPSEPKATSALKWLDKYCKKSDIDIFTEIIVYSKELKIAGTIDILAYDKTEDVYEIIDWKTSKKIKTRSFNNKMGNHPVTATIMDCNFNHYALQLSLYRYLLENHYGIKVRNQLIGHLKDSQCKGYITPYYSKQISDILSAIN